MTYLPENGVNWSWCLPKASLNIFKILLFRNNNCISY